MTNQYNYYNKLSYIYTKILYLYRKSHLWAIGFTTMVWSYRNYHKQCGKSTDNLVFWHDQCIYKICGSFEIEGNNVDVLDCGFMGHMIKSSSEHKGIRVRPAPVNSFIQSAVAILYQTHIKVTYTIESWMRKEVRCVFFILLILWAKFSRQQWVMVGLFSELGHWWHIGDTDVYFLLVAEKWKRERDDPSGR